MKRLIVLLAVLVTGLMSFAAIASAGVQRTQPTATLTINLTTIPGNVHTFVIAWTNPCGTEGAFTGTGFGSPVSGSATETITGSLVGSTLTFSATYLTFIPGYTWAASGPLAGSIMTDSYGGSYPIASTVAPIMSYKSHGDYVSAMGGGDDAAHSCIGMPIAP
jgi:hypothetical protein